jgi:beta-glucanase (GH16 family)
VAQLYHYKSNGSNRTSAAITSKTGAIEDTWTLEFIDDFKSKNVTNTQWIASQGNFGAKKGRECSADYAANGSISDGFLKLKVSKLSGKVATEVAETAESGCPNGVFSNSSWKTHYVMQYGIVAARIKLAKDQGSHGSFWLYTSTDYEIDVVESYGLGYGITTGTWIQGKQNLGPQERTIPQSTKDPSWWDKYHVFSVEWNPKGYIFRIDGVETHRIDTKVPKQYYRLFLTNYSSDWELYRMTNPVAFNGKPSGPAKLPTVMTVDWVQAWTK